MIPEKWRFVPLAEILTRVRNPVSVDNDTSYREIGIRSHGKGIFYKNPKTGEELGNKSVFWIEPECFVVNIVFAWEQAVAKTTIQEKGMIASHRFPMYKAKSSHLSLEYLLYFFKTSKGKYLLELASPGGAGRNKTLGQTEFLKLEILLPPISEQLKIVEILGVWDESIDLLERLIGRVRSRKQGLMQQLLTGKKRFKEFESSEWKSYSFSEIVKLRSKKFDPKISSESKICVELEHISQISGKLLGTIDSSKQASTKNYFFTGDVLFGKLRPYLRKYLLAQFDGVCSTEIWVLVSQKYITPNYLFYLVQTSEFIATANVSSGSKMPRADWGYISEVSFRLPPLPEQEKIAAVLSAADEEISTLEKQLAAYKQQKLGLMQQLLTGKIRVGMI